MLLSICLPPCNGLPRRSWNRSPFSPKWIICRYCNPAKHRMDRTPASIPQREVCRLQNVRVGSCTVGHGAVLKSGLRDGVLDMGKQAKSSLVAYQKYIGLQFTVPNWLIRSGLLAARLSADTLDHTMCASSRPSPVTASTPIQPRGVGDSDLACPPMPRPRRLEDARSISAASQIANRGQPPSSIVLALHTARLDHRHILCESPISWLIKQRHHSIPSRRVAHKDRSLSHTVRSSNSIPLRWTSLSPRKLPPYISALVHLLILSFLVPVTTPQ